VFADKAGFHRAQVGAFERGEMNIKLASLLLIAQTLGLKVSDLFQGCGALRRPAPIRVVRSRDACAGLARQPTECRPNGRGDVR
jgi:transcriptional regulator with XRE-family HTH domain